MVTRYVLDTLNAPVISRFGRVIKPVAFIRIGRHRAALFFNRDELPEIGRLETLLERQGFELAAYKTAGEYAMLAYRLEAD